MRILKAGLIVIAVSAIAYAQAPSAEREAKLFHPRDYPADKFRISKQEYPLGDLTIRVINVKNSKGDIASVPSFCSAWLEVLRGSQLIRRISYNDIEPVGFNYGAFVSKRQPKDYFALVKTGDYDGRLLLVDRAGKVVDLPGGFYFMTADGKYIVSEYASDDAEPAFTVFDLASQHIVLQPKGTPELGSWYRDDSGYFVMEYDNPGHAERLDLEKPQVIKFNVTAEDRKKAMKVSYDFDPRKKEDCLSTPQ